MSNAIKYNRRGGKVTIAGQTDGAYLKIAVTDTGIGIPAAALPNLFNEFYRVATPETRYIAGTGLGLSIVKRIADAHHGQVTVQSQPGAGSTFAVSLPIPVAPHLQ